MSRLICIYIYIYTYIYIYIYDIIVYYLRLTPSLIDILLDVLIYYIILYYTILGLPLPSLRWSRFLGLDPDTTEMIRNLPVEAQVSQLNPLLFYSQRGILYYSTPREESFSNNDMIITHKLQNPPLLNPICQLPKGSYICIGTGEVGALEVSGDVWRFL